MGLIPCAVGGTFLDEWMPDFTPSGQIYWPNATNLFDAAVQRTAAALTSAPAGSCLKGLVWYQGESDATDEALAETYDTRFVAFLRALRAALLPSAIDQSPYSTTHTLPVVTVAVTAAAAVGKLDFPGLSAVRRAQFSSALSLPAVALVDAFGLQLSAQDGVHITAEVSSYPAALLLLVPVGQFCFNLTRAYSLSVCLFSLALTPYVCLGGGDRQRSCSERH